MKYRIFSFNIALLVLFSIILLSIQKYLPPSSDTVWLMHCAQLMLKGMHNYFSFFETNPPMIRVILMPAVFLKNTLNLTDYMAAAIWCLAIQIIISIWVLLILTRINKNQFIKTTVIYLGFLTAFFILPGYAFTEREVLCALFFTPYLLLLSEQMNGVKIRPSESIIACIVMSAGIFFKLYFLIPLVAMECYRLSSLDKNKVKHYLKLKEPWVILLSLILFSVLTVFIDPEYYSKVLPVTVKLYINSYETQSLFIMMFSQVGMLIIFLCLYLVFLAIKNRKNTLFIALIISGISFYVVYLLPRQLFFYHLFPFIAFAAITVFYSITIKQDLIRIVGFALSLYVIYILFAAGNTVPLITRHKEDSKAIAAKSFLEKKTASTTVLVLSHNFLKPQLQAITNYKYVSRYPAVMFVCGIEKLKHQGDLKRYSNYKRWFINQYISDMNKMSPQYIVLDDDPVVCSFQGNQDKRFLIKTFFNSNPSFEALFNAYHKIKTIGQLSIYARSKR